MIGLKEIVHIVQKGTEEKSINLIIKVIIHIEKYRVYYYLTKTRTYYYY